MSNSVASSSSTPRQTASTSRVRPLHLLLLASLCAAGASADDLPPVFDKLEERCFEKSEQDACDELSDLYGRAGRHADAAAITAKECTVETNILDFPGMAVCLRHLDSLEKANALDEARKLTSVFCEKGADDMCVQLAELESSRGNDDKALALVSAQCFKYTPQSCRLREGLLAKKGIEAAKSYYEE